MFEYFPNNYVWNFSINIALAMGGVIGEIDEACRPLREFSAPGADSGTEAFFNSWCAVADRIVGMAKRDEDAGRNFSAADKYGRASVYYQIAERMQSRHYAPRWEAYRKMLDSFMKSVRLGRDNCERVEIPYKGTTLAALFTRAGSAGKPAPCMVHLDGLDSSKEMGYRFGTSQALLRRGISTLIVDHPGVGEALRLQKLSAFPESEVWAGAAVDYLEKFADVDKKRIGVMAYSLGGYYAPRAAAFEPRFNLCVAWGANYNWGEMQKRRLANEGDRPVPHYWDHVQWVWGKNTLEEFMAFAPRVSLEGVLHRITAPFLIVHGGNDRQIPLEYAHKTYDDAINSVDRKLHIQPLAEGSAEHCGLDNVSIQRDYVVDWIAEKFGGITA